jgi:hypothetical protein
MDARGGASLVGYPPSQALLLRFRQGNLGQNSRCRKMLVERWLDCFSPHMFRYANPTTDNRIRQPLGSRSVRRLMGDIPCWSFRFCWHSNDGAGIRTRSREEVLCTLVKVRSPRYRGTLSSRRSSDTNAVLAIVGEVPTFVAEMPRHHRVANRPAGVVPTRRRRPSQMKPGGSASDPLATDCGRLP